MFKGGLVTSYCLLIPSLQRILMAEKRKTLMSECACVVQLTFFSSLMES